MEETHFWIVDLKQLDHLEKLLHETQVVGQ